MGKGALYVMHIINFLHPHILLVYVGCRSFEAHFNSYFILLIKTRRLEDSCGVPNFSERRKFYFQFCSIITPVNFFRSWRSIGIFPQHTSPLYTQFYSFQFSYIVYMMLSLLWSWLTLNLEMYPSVTRWTCLQILFQCLCFQSHLKVSTLSTSLALSFQFNSFKKDELRSSKYQLS